MGLLAFLGYWQATNWISTLPSDRTSQFEQSVRRHEKVVELLPRNVRRFKPRHQDLYLHFFLFLPYGVMAAAAGRAGVALWGTSWRRRSFGIALGVALLVPLYEEYRQLSVPSRTASFEDLYASWAGILVGFGLAWLTGRIVAAGVRRWRRRKNHALDAPEGGQTDEVS
ncbi:MAG: VanZ family protein [Candidatus Sumerlaeia bacterium]|nr:VanZ family protein [Candidatus Sumerlaeia bacterium]